jgi:hypothetical protein
VNRAPDAEAFEHRIPLVLEERAAIGAANPIDQAAGSVGIHR